MSYSTALFFETLFQFPVLISRLSCCLQFFPPLGYDYGSPVVMWFLLFLLKRLSNLTKFLELLSQHDYVGIENG